MASKRRLKRSDRKRKCEGKVRHKTLQDAERACKITAWRHKVAWLTTYHCKYCGSYHCGTAPMHVRAKMLARE